MVVGGSGDASEVPEVALPLVEAGILAVSVEEKHVGRALDGTAACEAPDAGGAHAVESRVAAELVREKESVGRDEEVGVCGEEKGGVRGGATGAQ